MYKMTIIVVHNNKCHIYRSVGGSAIYIYYNVVYIQAYLYHQEKNMNIIKFTYNMCHSNKCQIYSSKVFASNKK